MLSIIKAAAGSGKTFTLAYEYIRLLLSKAAPDGSRTLIQPGEFADNRAILAITFTNKATNEMKRRIINELAILARRDAAGNEKSEYLDRLVDDLKADPKKIAERASQALDSLLADFSFFNVSTIDAFFQSVLRAFTREADLPAAYEVELDDIHALSAAVDAMINDFNHGYDVPTDPGNHHLKSSLLTLMRHKRDAGKAFDILNRDSSVHNGVISEISNFWDETYALNIDAMEEYLRDPKRVNLLRDKIAHRINTLDKNLREKAAIVNSAIADHPGAAARAAAIVRRVADEGFVSNSKTLISLAEDPSTFFKASALKKLDISPWRPILDDLAGAINDARSTPLLREILSNIYVLTLMGRVSHHLKLFRSENSTVLLSDTDTILRRIIGDDSSPFIYERLGNRLKNFLIDEFQDTSGMQWLNLRPLVDESLSNGNFSLVIGDEKQCIYRFRDSDPSLLTNLHNDFPGLVDTKRNVENAVSTNYRSAPEVVRFNNTLFAAIAQILPAVAPYYRAVVQKIHKADDPYRGFVEVMPLSSDNDPNADPNDDIFRDAPWARPVVANIRAQLLEGYRPGDIAVLFRKSKDGAALIDLLNRIGLREGPASPFHNLKVAGDDALYLNSSTAVRMVISVLRLFVAADLRPRKNADGKPTFAGREHLMSLMINEFENSLSNGVAEADALNNALRCYAENLVDTPSTPLDNIADDPDSLTLIQLVESIIDRFVSEEARQVENLYISSLLDVVADFCDVNAVSDPRAFLRWWSQKCDSLSVGGAAGPDTLRIMTIHKSKGLEFPAVHVPLVNWRENTKDEFVWVDPDVLSPFVDDELLPPMIPVKSSKTLLSNSPYEDLINQIEDERTIDDINLLYVALTRAGDRLAVYTNPDANAMGRVKIINEALKLIADPAKVEQLPTPDVALISPVNHPADTPDRFSLGIPQFPRHAKVDKPTALDPQDSEPMPPVNVIPHPEIWNYTVLESSEDD